MNNGIKNTGVLNTLHYLFANNQFSVVFATRRSQNPSVTIDAHTIIIFFIVLMFLLFVFNFLFHPVSFTAQVQDGLQQLLRPTVAEVPVVVDDKLKVHG